MSMESRAKLLGHPVHQMLIPIPAGLLIVAAVLDIVDAVHSSAWIPTVTFWNIAVAIVMGLIAAIFGVIDWTKIPNDTRAKRIGTVHGIGNVVVVVIFAAALWLRSRSLSHRADMSSLVLEIVAFFGLGVTAWLGGELVDRLGIGVDDGAHANAPSSLTAKHAKSSVR
jgi:uncharacterized membrane protein